MLGIGILLFEVSCCCGAFDMKILLQAYPIISRKNSVNPLLFSKQQLFGCIFIHQGIL